MDKKKVGFFSIQLSFTENEEEQFSNVNDSLPPLLSYICELNKINRKHELTSEKFCFIDSCNYNEHGKIAELLFKSAKHSYRAPLIDKNTVESRDNPKRIEEGEQIKTHVLLKFQENEAIVFLETGQNHMKMANIIDYLNSFIPSYNESSEEKIVGSFIFYMIPNNDFREVLNNMSRVVCAEIYINKSLLGSEALNFSNITENVQENIVLSVKSEKKKTIKTMVYDVVNKFNDTKSSIRRIRIKGRMSNNNEAIIDTEHLVKKEYIEVERNRDTGEYDTPSVFAQLKMLSNDYRS